MEKKYKLVGILQDKKSIIGYSYLESDQYDTLIPAILVSNKEKIDAGGKEMLAFYIKCKIKILMKSVNRFHKKPLPK